MDAKTMEEALLEVAGRAGISVRLETFDSATFAQVQKRGGLCRMGGASVLLVDRSLSVIERVGVLADGLSGLSLDAVSMLPAVRERIDLAARRRAARPRPRLRRVV